jgi:hypothetical protein
MLSLAEAAALAGVAKSTLFRAIRSGKVSAQRTETGQFQLDPAEVTRAFPPRSAVERDSNAPPAHHAMVDILVAELRATIADLRADRDHWRSAFETAQRALPAPAEQLATADAPAATPAPNDALAAPNGARAPSRLVRAWRWMRATG